ncbi:hypothetical protein [Actinacidiphila acidipaludis]|uniref:Uncharacterized protein n=1 Tax=Actinacidiphila acidipaludis TaxID=2873382 RepID=A0ABS7Q3W5_9ACTN|nr:hypothetical protein [Streptomyces acidipaludis]MBY8877839.1 hypothetical protein [Streptomyces acidipaludis]
MSDAKPTDHAHEAVGRHRGSASSDEADRSDTSQAPHGRHRRPQDD